MSHTHKIVRGNSKRKGKEADELARENKNNRKKERALREARKHKHD